VSTIGRRRFLRLAAGAACLPLAACSMHRRAALPCAFDLSRFDRVPDLARDVRRIGQPSDPAVVLLHELPGLTPWDLSLAQCLADRHFNVYVPVLFGEPGQDNVVFGYFQSCATAEFECSRLSAESPVVDGIERVVDHAHARSGKPVGVIGMCLTGVFPLALLRSPHVGAAVVCQPTLPFRVLAGRPVGAQTRNLGLGQDDLVAALKSDVPFLALRYASDPLCPKERMDRLASAFGSRVTVIEIPTDDPRKHSTLAADHHPPSFEATVRYLNGRLRR
jgi:dienelactone hydrolase